LRHLQRLDPKATERDLRGFLGGFGFQGDTAMAEVAPFSGGEKARLALALIVYQRPNLLLLDEPTNHLDLEMRHALASALQDFEGALLIVSHDRFLLRSVVDEFWLVAGGRVTTFTGDLEDYRRELDAHLAKAATEAAPASRKDQRRLGAEKRQQLRPLQQAMQKAETALAKLGSKRAELEAELADPALYEPGEKIRLQGLLKDKARLDQQIEQAELAWLEAGEALEAAEKLIAA
jgi:ATP-binding cassette, subfamily F, member 3